MNWKISFILGVVSMSSGVPHAMASGSAPLNEEQAVRAWARKETEVQISTQAPLPPNAIFNSESLAEISELSREPVLAGNKVELLQDGSEFFPKRLDLIRNAKKTIDLTTFMWCDDPAGLAVANELARAALTRNVRVRAVLSFMNVRPAKEVRRILESAGIELLTHNPANWGWIEIGHTNHEKIMVVDGRKSLIGGANLCEEYLTGGGKLGFWREMELLSEGPINARVQARFDENWNLFAEADRNARCGLATAAGGSGSGKEDPICAYSKYTVYSRPTPTDATSSGSAWLGFLYQQPYFAYGHLNTHKAAEKYDLDFRNLYLNLIKRAREQIVLYVPYLALPTDLDQALQNAAKRGIKVTLFTNSYHVNDIAKPLAGTATSYYTGLLSSGVKIHEFWFRTLHAKAMMIDQSAVVVGSHNITIQTFHSRGESSLITEDPGVIRKFSAGVVRDLEKETKEVTLENYRQMRPDANSAILRALGHLLKDII